MPASSTPEPTAAITTTAATRASRVSWHQICIPKGFGARDLLLATLAPCGSAALVARGIGQSPWTVGALFGVTLLADLAFIVLAAAESSDSTTTGGVDIRRKSAHLAFIILVLVLTAAFCMSVCELRRAFRAFFVADSDEPQPPPPLAEELCMSACCCCCAMAQMASHVRARELSVGDRSSKRAVDVMPAFAGSAA